MTATSQMLSDCGLTASRVRAVVGRAYGNGTRLILKCGFRNRAHVQAALARVADDDARRALMLRITGGEVWPK